MRGDLVTPDTVFQVTGKLIKKIEIPVTEAMCTRKTNKKIVNIHVPFLRFAEAVNSCNKFSAGSIIGDFQARYTMYNVNYLIIFQDLTDWESFYSISNNNPAVMSHCRTGGRYLHWLGYRATNFSQLSPEHFLHVGTNNTLAVEAWRPKQPNGNSDPQCLISYMGLEYTKSW